MAQRPSCSCGSSVVSSRAGPTSTSRSSSRPARGRASGSVSSPPWAGATSIVADGTLDGLVRAHARFSERLRVAVRAARGLEAHTARAWGPALVFRQQGVPAILGRLAADRHFAFDGRADDLRPRAPAPLRAGERPAGPAVASDRGVPRGSTASRTSTSTARWAASWLRCGKTSTVFWPTSSLDRHLKTGHASTGQNRPPGSGASRRSCSYRVRSVLSKPWGERAGARRESRMLLSVG
jgi:hypothetical protein